MAYVQTVTQAPRLLPSWETTSFTDGLCVEDEKLKGEDRVMLFRVFYGLPWKWHILLPFEFFSSVRWSHLDAKGVGSSLLQIAEVRGTYSSVCYSMFPSFPASFPEADKSQILLGSVALLSFEEPFYHKLPQQCGDGL